MKNISINLIEGTFENEKARKLLLDLISFKIKYHQNKKFSNEERFGTDQEQSAQRIAQLQAEEIQLQNWFKQLTANEPIHISGTINLEVNQ